ARVERSGGARSRRLRMITRSCRRSEIAGTCVATRPRTLETGVRAIAPHRAHGARGSLTARRRWRLTARLARGLSARAARSNARHHRASSRFFGGAALDRNGERSVRNATLSALWLLLGTGIVASTAAAQTDETEDSAAQGEGTPGRSEEHTSELQ